MTKKKQFKHLGIAKGPIKIRLKNHTCCGVIVKSAMIFETVHISGMSEIRDRAKAAPAKSQNFRDTGLPASGKKFRSSNVPSSGKAVSIFDTKIFFRLR